MIFASVTMMFRIHSKNNSWKMQKILILPRVEMMISLNYEDEPGNLVFPFL